MEHACQITFVGMEATEPIRVEIRAWLQRLAPLTNEVQSGHLLVEAIDVDRKIRTYRVRMDLSMTGGAVVTVSNDHPSNAAHEDAFVAVRNAFRAARRQMEIHYNGRSPAARIAPAAPMAAALAVNVAEPALDPAVRG